MYIQMNGIENTPLFTEDRKNSLIVCPFYNDYEQVFKFGKHTHQKLVFLCIQCGRRDYQRNDSVIHVSKSFK
jgi:hypothetical protein